MRERLRSVDTVSGREYSPGPNRVLLRSVERVKWPSPPPLLAPCRRAKIEDAVPVCAPSGACRACAMDELKESPCMDTWRVYCLLLRRLMKTMAATRSARAPVWLLEIIDYKIKSIAVTDQAHPGRLLLPWLVLS